ncbi:uncharacterized protein LOC113791954 [Dermatophagoides pteronyssinus]|uniref:uncharacterized protein LOC113791954 n=1 Tax=Dermatophagoides pteronyssinus TaxID=6956 RepID=UPI003F6816E8
MIIQQQLTKLSIMIKNIIYNELKISITKNRAKITSSTILFIFLIVLFVENFLTTIVIAAQQQQQHKQSIIPSSAIINGSVEFSPITNRTSESIVSNAKNSSTTSSPSTRVNNFATKIGTLLKILQIVNHVASISSTARESLIRNHPVENRNDSQSETRSMSTWFGFTKKTPASTIRRSNHQHHHQQSQHSFNDQATNMQTAMHRPTFIPISQPSLPPPHHPSFQSFDSPNPFLLIPPLSDTSAIDYWLKLLEDPKFEEQIMPILWSGRNHHRYHNRKPFDYDDKFLSNSHLNNNPWMGKKNRKFKINSRNSEQSKSNLSNKRKYNQGNKDEDDNGDHYEYDPNGYPDKWSLQNDIENGSDFDNIMMLTPNVRPNQRDKKPKPYMLDNFNQQQQQLQNQQHQQFDTTPRCDKFTEDICIDDFEYPEHAILDEIYKRKDIFQLMYAEVNGEVPLVDGITKDMDENFSQDYYYNNNDPEDPDDDYHDDFNGPQTSKRHHSSTNKSTSLDFDESNNHQQNSHNKNSIEHGFVCRTEVLYAKPKLAKNLKRKWRVIVNAGDFTQTIRLEKCNKANSECRYIADHKYASRCAQIHSIHRLLVFEKGKGFFIDSFRIPTACACHVYSVKQTNSNPNESKINDLRTKISIGDSMESNKSLWSMLSNNNNNNNNNPVQSYDDDNGNNNHYLNNDGNNRAQSSKLYYHSHSNQNQVTKQMQQQLKQALNLLNNKEFFKLLPQLTSIDATTSMNSKWDDNNDDNVLLQKLLENLATTSSTTGKVPSNFLLTTTTTTKPNNNKNNHYMNDNNHHMNRFTIIPDYQFNLSDMNEGNKADDDLLTNAEHNFGMTTNPNQRNKQHISTTFGSISGHQPTSAQAPVVQVIHMPVSTNGLDIPATVNRLAHWPYQFDQHDDQHSSTSLSLLMPSSSQSQSPSQSSLSKYLASASDSHYFQQQQQQKSKINNDTLAYNNMTLTTIQTNNHTISDILNDNNTTMAIVNEDVNHRHDDDDDETRKDVHDNDNNSDDDNTKINFSYHPILDYIVN